MVKNKKTQAKKNTSSEIRNIWKNTLLKKDKVINSSNKLLSDMSDKNDIKKIIEKTLGLGKISADKVLLVVFTIAQLHMKFDGLITDTVNKKLLEQYNTKGTDLVTLLNRIVTSLSYILYNDRDTGKQLNSYIFDTQTNINKLLAGLASKKSTFKYDQYSVSTLISWAVMLHKKSFDLKQDTNIGKTYLKLLDMYFEKKGNIPQIYINYMFLLNDIILCDIDESKCKNKTTSFQGLDLNNTDSVMNVRTEIKTLVEKYSENNNR